jgi:hypothetical protein
MKLIIVQRSRPDAYTRLRKQFADQLGVEVVFERRTRQRRRTSLKQAGERRSRDRRRLTKPFGGKDYIVIYIAG